MFISLINYSHLSLVFIVSQILKVMLILKIIVNFTQL